MNTGRSVQKLLKQVFWGGGAGRVETELGLGEEMEGDLSVGKIGINYYERRESG